MRRVATTLFIILLIQCSTVEADYADADKAYETGDHTRAFSEYKALAERGDVRAQLNVGWMYYYGEGVRQDKTQAMVWYLKAAGQGDVTSMFNLAYSYEHGEGVKPDLNESQRWYKVAVEQGNALKHLNLKRLTKAFSSTDIARTHVARAWDEKQMRPANAGEVSRNASAAAAIAGTASLAAAVREEERKAELAASRWRTIYMRNSANIDKFQPAGSPGPIETRSARVAEKDNAESPLSISARTSVEMSQNPRLEKIRRAAEKGDTHAQVALGWAYSSGKEIPADKARAAAWYRLAAEKGNLNAQIALGWMYYDGQGIERNLKEAAYWYTKAAAQGDMKARHMLKRIKDLAR